MLDRLAAIGFSSKPEDKFIMNLAGCKNSDDWIMLLYDQDKLNKLSEKLSRFDGTIRQKYGNVIPLFKGK